MASADIIAKTLTFPPQDIKKMRLFRGRRKFDLLFLFSLYAPRDKK